MAFEHSIVIRAMPAQLFALTQDYSRRLEWDPFLKEAYLLDGATETGVGVRANCVAKSGLAMETEYVSFNPPWTTAVKMTKGPWFIESFSGSWRFREEEEGQTRVHFRYNLRARPRWLAMVMTPVIGFIFRRDTRKRLVALKRAVEEDRILESTCARK
jgi:ribosome-associated toxin RatA of RatAB toxin-antitoxin module